MLGVSPDNDASHKKFIEKFKLRKSEVYVNNIILVELPDRAANAFESSNYMEISIFNHSCSMIDKSTFLSIICNFELMAVENNSLCVINENERYTIMV